MNGPGNSAIKNAEMKKIGFIESRDGQRLN